MNKQSISKNSMINKFGFEFAEYLFNNFSSEYIEKNLDNIIKVAFNTLKIQISEMKTISGQ